MVSTNKRHRRDQEAIVAFFDIDHTLIEGNASRLFAKHFRDKAWISQLQLLKAAWWNILYRWNIIDERKVLSRMLRLLQGWDVRRTQQACEKAFGRVKNHFSSRMLERVRFHQSQGHKTVLVTTLPSMLAELIRAYLDMDGILATELEMREHKFTGNVLLFNLAETKAELVQQLALDQQYSLEESFAYADSFSDRALLSVVGHPIAVNPDKKLKAHALKHGWEILKH